jgi:Domain of unknown function (DUF4129)
MRAWVRMKRGAAYVLCGVMLWFAGACPRASAYGAFQSGGSGVSPSTAAASLPNTQALTLPGFSAELRRLENLIGGGKSPDHFAALQRELPADWQVQTPSRTYSIATAPLRLLLQKESPDDAEAWLHNLRAQAESAEAEAGAKQHDADAAASAELKSILAESRFGAVAPPGWLEVQRQKLYHWIGELFDKIFGGLARHPLGTEILFWMLIAGAVGFVAMLVWRYFARRDGLDKWQAGAAAPVRLRTWQEWLRTAREAAARGDYREAVHSAYWAGIFRLQDTGALPRDRAKTPREYLRALDAPRPASAESREKFKQPLAAITTLFERVWYANRGVREEDFIETLRQLEALGCRLD